MLRKRDGINSDEEGFSINLCLAGEFEVDSFDIKFEFDKELNM